VYPIFQREAMLNPRPDGEGLRMLARLLMTQLLLLQGPYADEVGSNSDYSSHFWLKGHQAWKD
jgi:hypothetical protein